MELEKCCIMSFKLLHVVTFRFDSAENELPEVEFLTNVAILMNG